MDSLKLAMAWDEKVYGREYDLDQFNIVAVSDFNMGAMENKSLNIFNSAYVLADQETATDADFDNIARRRRARIFPQLVGRPRDLPRLVPAVAEGRLHRLPRPELLGRHRKPGGQADRGCARAPRGAVPRRRRARSPIRCGPTAIIEISNFYTATVYNKGAEVIRMMAHRAWPGEVPRRHRSLFRPPRRRGGDLRRFREGAGGRERRRPDAVQDLVQPGRNAEGQGAAGA